MPQRTQLKRVRINNLNYNIMLDKYELIDFLEWAEHEGYVHYVESNKVEMVIEYLKTKI